MYEEVHRYKWRTWIALLPAAQCIVGGQNQKQIEDAKVDLARLTEAPVVPGQHVKYRSQVTTCLPEDGLPSPLGHEHHMVFAVPFGMG